MVEAQGQCGQACVCVHVCVSAQPEATQAARGPLGRTGPCLHRTLGLLPLDLEMGVGAWARWSKPEQTWLG